VYDGVLRRFGPQAYRRRIDAAYAEIFRRERAGAVLAQYGPTGVVVMGACRQLGLPLFVSFHGYDVGQQDVLERFGPDYAALFHQAAGVFAVSDEMRGRLIEMGAPAHRTYSIPAGADCEMFAGGDPAAAPPVVIAVGRFVEKKAPQVTLEAFARAHADCPEARLVMIGDGPLLASCTQLAASLGVAHAVRFTGSLPHHRVAEEMRGARLFAQHSVRAASGDAEGTPVSIQEACATGLPVVSTRHAGIPEVVIVGETGLLVDEGDVDGMAEQMVRLLSDPAYAAALGAAGQRRARDHFSAMRSIEREWSIIEHAL
jgi:glycosyltransferase involved in cell wall biosynthesis